MFFFVCFSFFLRALRGFMFLRFKDYSGVLEETFDLDGGVFEGFAVVEDEVDGEVAGGRVPSSIQPDDFDLFGVDDGLEDIEILAGQFERRWR